MGDRALYNPNDGLTGRDGGPYLDIEEAKRAEIRRAEVEGREPDFENLPPSAGIQLVTATSLLNTVGVNQPSKADAKADADEKVVKGFADDEDNPMRVIETVKAENYAQVESEDDLENNEFPLREQLAVSDKGQEQGDNTDVDSGEKVNNNDKSSDSVVLDEDADDDDIINALTVDDGTDSTTDSASKAKSTTKSTAKSGK